MSLTYFPIKSRRAPHQKRHGFHQEESFYEIQNEIKFKNGLLTMITQQTVERHPHNCVGLIIVTDNNNNKGHGTAFSIGPNLALTAAHNIGTFKEGKFTHKSIVFYPGLSNASSNKAWCQKRKRNVQEQYDTCGIKVKSFKYPQQYETQKNPSKNCQYDYALIQLQQNVQRDRYFELGIDYKQIDQEIFNIGYQKGDVNYEDECAIQKLGSAKGTHYLKDGFILCHKLPTQAGSSGGPIFVYRNQIPVAIAIHKGSDYEEQISLARVISREVLDNLRMWEKEFYLEDCISCIKANTMTATSDIVPIKQEASIIQSKEKIEDIQSKIQQFEVLSETTQQLELQAKEQVKEQSKSMQESLQKSNLEAKTTSQEAKSKVMLNIPKVVEDRKYNIDNRQVPYVSKDPYFWDNSSPFAKRFKITQKRAIYAFQDYIRYQITSLKPLFQHSVIKMKVKYGRGICIGILTQARKKYQSSGERGSGQTESIGYWLYPAYTTGEVIQNGEECHQKNKNLFVPEGSQITIEFDHKGRLVFYHQMSQKKICVEIGKNFVDKDLYLFASMANKNDEIRITSF